MCNLQIILPLVLVASLQAATKEHLIAEHVLGGLPSNDQLLVRNAYVLDYDSVRKAPRWVAYRVTQDYRRTPKRTGRWETYRADPDVANEPKEADYTGVFADPLRNYARGHLAPFMICGGDRDGDGMILDADRDGKVEAGDDEDEADTVLQINYHTNLTPQHHDGFNGSGGVWYGIEERIRSLIDDGTHSQLWVFAGPIFGPAPYDAIGEQKDVHVAPMFFQIIVWKTNEATYDWEAYMMPHHQVAHASIKEHLVSIRHIEAMTALDFFSELDLQERERRSTYPQE